MQIIISKIFPHFVQTVRSIFRQKLHCTCKNRCTPLQCSFLDLFQNSVIVCKYIWSLLLDVKRRKNSQPFYLQCFFFNSIVCKNIRVIVECLPNACKEIIFFDSYCLCKVMFQFCKAENGFTFQRLWRVQVDRSNNALQRTY